MVENDVVAEKVKSKKIVKKSIKGKFYSYLFVFIIGFGLGIYLSVYLFNIKVDVFSIPYRKYEYRLKNEVILNKNGVVVTLPSNTVLYSSGGDYYNLPVLVNSNRINDILDRGKNVDKNVDCYYEIANLFIDSTGYDQYLLRNQKVKDYLKTHNNLSGADNLFADYRNNFNKYLSLFESDSLSYSVVASNPSLNIAETVRRGVYDRKAFMSAVLSKIFNEEVLPNSFEKKDESDSLKILVEYSGTSRGYLFNKSVTLVIKENRIYLEKNN